MNTRRSRLEIVLAILLAIRSGVDKPTRIMYAANMSWAPVQKMLKNLVTQGLIEIRMSSDSKQSKKRYIITEKGENLLDYFDRANKVLSLDKLFAAD